MTTSPLLMNALNSSMYFFTGSSGVCGGARLARRRAVRVKHTPGVTHGVVEVLESVDVAQVREDHRPRADDTHRQQAADPHGRPDAEERPGDTRLEGAELVGGADEDVLDRHHPAAHVVGRGERHDRRPDEHADGVGAGEHEQRDERQRVAVSDPEDDGGRTEDEDGDVERPADVPSHRAHGEQRGHDHGPDAGRRAQPAVPDAADTEALLGDRREQGDGASEQDGEHVERDGTEAGPADGG